MNNKIYEEALASALKRIEVLEDKISRISIPNKQGFYEPSKQTPGTSTSGQLGYIKKLGGKADSSMSKKEASNEIDRLLEKRGDEKIETECEKIVEPKEVDTEDVGIDEEGLI